MLRQILIEIAVCIFISLSFYGMWQYKDHQVIALQKELSYLAEQAQEIALRQSKELNDEKAKADQRKQEALAANTASYTRIINGLRQHQNRPANLPSNPNPPSSCTGAQLYREDGEFLAGEAARADQVRIERDYYYEQYESVRRNLAGQGKDAGLNGKVSNTEPVLGASIQ